MVNILFVYRYNFEEDLSKSIVQIQIYFSKLRQHTSFYKDYCVLLKTYFFRFLSKLWVEEIEKCNLWCQMHNDAHRYC